MKIKLTFFEVSIFLAGLACALNAFLYSFYLMFLSNKFDTGNYLGAYILLSMPFYIVGIFLYYFFKIKRFQKTKWVLIIYAAYTGVMIGVIGLGNFIRLLKTHGLLEAVQNHFELLIYLTLPIYFCTSAIINEFKNNKNA